MRARSLVQHQSCLSIVILLLVIQATASRAEDTAPTPTSRGSDPALVHFGSTSGGFTIDIPKDWHAQEFSTETLYRSTISTATVQKAEDKIDLGMYVERTLDYKRAFGWEKDKPNVRAMSQIIFLATFDPVSRGTSVVVSFTPPTPTADQIAESIASARTKTPNGGKGLPAVVLIPHDGSITLPGMDTFQYDVITDYKGEHCIFHQFLIGIVKKQWISFHLVSNDCQNQAELASRFDTILRTLTVDKKWDQ